MQVITQKSALEIWSKPHMQNEERVAMWKKLMAERAKSVKK